MCGSVSFFTCFSFILVIGSKAKAEICLSLAERLSEQQLNIEKLRDEISAMPSQAVHPTIQGQYSLQSIKFIFVLIQKKITAPELTSGGNPNLQGASDHIDLTNSVETGNYIKAKTNIKAGDVLLVESPIVSCLLDKFFGTHCLHCKQR